MQWWHCILIAYIILNSTLTLECRCLKSNVEENQNSTCLLWHCSCFSAIFPVWEFGFLNSLELLDQSMDLLPLYLPRKGKQNKTKRALDTWLWCIKTELSTDVILMFTISNRCIYLRKKNYIWNEMSFEIRAKIHSTLTRFVYWRSDPNKGL